MLRYFQTKQFRQKIVIPAPLLYFTCFDTRQFFETLKGFSTKCFVTVTQKSSDGKSWYPPPLIHKLFHQWNTERIFPKQSTDGFLYEMLCYCETKQFRRKIVNPAPSLILYMFQYQTTFWNHEGFLYEMFCYCDTNKFRRKLLIPAPSFP